MQSLWDVFCKNAMSHDEKTKMNRSEDEQYEASVSSSGSIYVYPTSDSSECSTILKQNEDLADFAAIGRKAT